MKLNEVINAYIVVNDLVKNNEVYTAKTAFAMAKFLKTASEDVQFFNEKKDETIKKYGHANEDGSFGIPTSDTEAVKKFTNDLNELGELEIDDRYVKFDTKMLDELKLSVSQAMSLIPFIKD